MIGRKVFAVMRIGLFVVVLIGVVAITGCSGYYTQTVILDRTVNITSDWVTLQFSRPLFAKPNWEQGLLASVWSRYEKSTQGLFGMRMPDGTVIWPDVQIEDETGEWLSVNAKGFYGDELSFSDRALSGDGKRYVAVKLRSPRAITISRLVWESYDPREIKR